MEDSATDEESVRFVPAGVVGLEDVTEVAIFPNRLEVKVKGKLLTFVFDSFAKRQQNAFTFRMMRLFGRATEPLLVGEREFCTDRRYVTFHTTPNLKIHTPPDPPNNYAGTYLARINAILHRGGYATHDLS